VIAPEQLRLGFDAEPLAVGSERQRLLEDVRVNTLAKHAADLAAATVSVGEREALLVAVIRAVRV